MHFYKHEFCCQLIFGKEVIFFRIGVLYHTYYIQLYDSFTIRMASVKKGISTLSAP